ncbi:MAG: VWA domain-containing protein [Lachnospiraceae bacterium]|nr:VWA domain-containing protein [Lachnospiraceae bacterium]
MATETTTDTVCTSGNADAGGYETEAAYEAGDMAASETMAAGDMENEWNVAGAPGNDAGKSSAAMADKYRQAYEPENFNTEEYSYISENGYKSVMEDPLSTFSVDVDTASYGNIRRMIRAGGSIPADAVRIEELINYFDYDYPQPKDGEPFAVTTEYGDCPWNEEHRLLMIGLQAKDIDFEDRPASNFVFLLDVSGSMYADDKLPLVQKAFAMLAENLTANDRVSIVTYAGYESVVLDGVSGSEKAKIVAALEDLEAGGSTAGEAGIQKAYALAEKNFIPGGNNRVILATDGDLNVGISSESGLTRLIKEKKKSGVHLSVLGVGTGNIKDNKMEAMADNGDGNYNYLDSLYEAKKVLVDEMGGTLITVAKDVKIQVEFNPQYVSGYRLVGYENRLLRNEDFHNDKVDAGEIGAGHTVTALYEIIPGKGGGQTLKYQQAGEPVGSTELLTVSLRYKAPNGDTSKLMEHPVEADSYHQEMSDNLQFASAVAEFGMVLRDSENKGKASLEHVMELAEPCVKADSDGYRKEFLQLVQQAEELGIR